MKYLLTLFLIVCMLGLGIAQDSPSFASSTISFPVSDLDKSTQWYYQVLGEVENFSPAPGVIELQINDKTWLQLFDGSSTSGTILRLEVANIQIEYQRLKKLGLSPNPIEVVEGVISYFDFEDLDGNQLSFYQMESP